MEKDTAKELLESILKAIVFKPDEVEVEKKVDEMGVLLSVKLGEGDAGAVIGRGGVTIQAIRTVLNVVGAKGHARISIKLEVPEQGPSSTRSEKKEAPGKEDLPF